MSKQQRPNSVPAPCIVETGIIVNQDDISRLLNDLSQVRYIHTIDFEVQNEGRGWLQEIFSDPYQSTLIANGNLYINLQSFDYLQLSQSSNLETYFDLIQENRQLRLIPISRSTQEINSARHIDAATIETMVSDALSARFDVQLDDDEF
jgi:7-keto-8-aminopelargonate synthetase-like enzyme